ncbi:hypothetical protein [Burkholderia cenocepacia]|uniref:hypothetical protein n=1 Tax=Burkholderia cenocepacia TaxID=95486 RepID=UPI000F5B29BB|nr:hypothetical protein [Burkholderia cenocepacia]
MPQLQKANLGSAPNGDGGDDQRTANVRYNANVDVLAACVALGYTILGDNTTIAPDRVGVRFGLNIGVAGKRIVLPLAGSVMVNACVHLFNVGVGVDIGLQGSDGTQVTALAHGDWVTYASDGVSYWHVVARGKMLPDEVVSGFLSVTRGLSVGGDVAIGGRLSSVNSPNLLPNSTGELRNQCWSGTNFGVVAGTSGEGTVFINSAAINIAGYAMDYSDNIAISAGMQLILSAEIATNGLNAGQVYMKVESFNSTGTLLGTFSTTPISTKRDYTVMTASGKTPNGTTYVRVSRVADNAPNISQWGVAFRRIKLERGSSPSLYSQEASILYLQGAPAFDGRPTFGGNVPWDSWNLPRPLQHSDIGAIAAAGGEERDLAINDEVRLTLNFTPKANSVLSNATLTINVGNSSATANDFIAYLDVFDVGANAVVARGSSNVVSVPNGQQYVGVSSAASLACAVAYGSLTIGKQYQIRLHVWKVQPIGPIYPRNMSINGVVV